MSDLIDREDAIKDAESWVGMNWYEQHLIRNVVEWLKEFPPAQLSTNLASLGTDCISRQQAIDALRGYLVGKRCPDDGTLTCRLIENEVINKLQPIQSKLLQPWEVVVAQAVLPQPEIVRCKDCSNYDTDWTPQAGEGYHYCSVMDNMMRSDDFCSYAERKETE